MSNQRSNDAESFLSTGILILIVALVIGSSLPGVKKWFEEQVLFWKIVNPLMALASLYLVYDGYRSKERPLILLKFIAAFIWTGGRSLVLYEVFVHPFIEVMSVLGLGAFLALSLVDIFVKNPEERGFV